jgi:hypothetical protein
MMNETTATLLLGAEGCSEASGVPWLRDATDEEVQAVLATEPKAGELLLDGTGRPYFWMTVLPGAPAWALAKARRVLRAVRLDDD